MSAKGLATLAVVRDERTLRKGDLGKAPVGSPEADEPPSNVDILSSALPTGLVATYTTFVASLSALKKPTPQDLTPDTYEVHLWIGLLALVVFAVGFVIKHYKQGGGTRFPLGEVAVAAIASIGWGLAIPNSPLAVSQGDRYSPATPVLIAFVFAGLVLLITDRGLQNART